MQHYRIKHGMSVVLRTYHCTEVYLIEDQKRRSLFYKQYPRFASAEDTEEMPGETGLAVIERLILHGNYSQARLRARSVIEATLEGLRYLQTWLVSSFQR